MRYIALVLALLVIAPLGRAENPFAPNPDSPLYKKIYDAVRHIPHPVFGTPVNPAAPKAPPWTNEPYAQLFPSFISVQRNWAIFDAALAPHKDGMIAATLHRVDGKWTPVHYWWHDDLPIGRDFRGSVESSPKAKDLPDALIRAWDKHFHLGNSLEKKDPGE
jgi:hypothetical protein